MAAIQNILLASLPRKEYQKLLPGLTPVTLEFGAVLFEPGGRMRDVYFPNGSLVSLLRLKHVAGRSVLIARASRFRLPNRYKPFSPYRTGNASHRCLRFPGHGAP